MEIEFENDFETKYYCENVDEFYEFIQYSFYKDNDKGVNFINDCIFRGVGCSNYTLTPTILRNIPPDFIFADQLLKEISYIHLFVKYCNDNGLYIPCNVDISDVYFADIVDTKRWTSDDDPVWPNKKIMNLLSLMQHYGLSTRFLDWTQDIYVSMYFATKKAEYKYKENKNESKRFSVWAFNAKQFQKINNSIDNNIPLTIYVPEYYSNPNTKAQKGVLTTWIINLKNLYRLGGYNKPYPKDDIDTEKFLLHYLKGVSPRNIVGKILFKFDFPYNEIEKSLQILKDQKYVTSRMFPGYDGVAKQVKEDLTSLYSDYSKKMLL